MIKSQTSSNGSKKWLLEITTTNFTDDKKFKAFAQMLNDKEG